MVLQLTGKGEIVKSDKEAEVILNRFFTYVIKNLDLSRFLYSNCLTEIIKGPNLKPILK